MRSRLHRHRHNVPPFARLRHRSPHNPQGRLSDFQHFPLIQNYFIRANARRYWVRVFMNGSSSKYLWLTIFQSRFGHRRGVNRGCSHATEANRCNGMEATELNKNSAVDTPASADQVCKNYGARQFEYAFVKRPPLSSRGKSASEVVSGVCENSYCVGLISCVGCVAQTRAELRKMLRTASSSLQLRPPQLRQCCVPVAFMCVPELHAVPHVSEFQASRYCDESKAYSGAARPHYQ